MIPLRDDAPRYTTPFINYFLIVANVLVFFFELLLPPRAQEEFVYQFAVVPAALTHSIATLNPFGLLPLLTSMFLHAGWGHIISNMWVLWIFGDNIEDQLGHFRYLLFYLAAGIAGSLVQVLFSLGSDVPSLGASGAIAGVMGAYFLLFPSARVLTIFPPIFFFYLPAWVVLGYWFIVQFLSGAASAITYHHNAGGVAFWAHVGGFLTGITLIKLMPLRPVHSARRLSWGEDS